MSLWALKTIGAVIFGRAVLAVLNAMDIYPDKWIAKMILGIPTPGVLSFSMWAFALIIALLLLTIEVWLHPLSRLLTLALNKFGGEGRKESWLADLADLRELGVTLRNHNPNSSAELQEWINSCGRWWSRTRDKISQYDPVEAKMFNKLDRYSPAPLRSDYFSEEHYRWETMMTELLVRLLGIIRTYKPSSIPPAVLETDYTSSTASYAPGSPHVVIRRTD